MARAVAAAGGLLWAALLAHLAGPALVGEFFIALALLTGANVLSRAGSDTGLMQHIGPRTDDETTLAILRSALVLTLLLSMLFAVLLLIAREYIEALFSGRALAGLLLGMAPGLVPLALCSVLLSFLKARRQPALASLLEMGAVLGVAAAMLALLFLSVGRVDAVAVGLVFALSATFCAAVAVWRCREVLRRLRDQAQSDEIVAVRAYLRDSRVYVVSESAAFAQQVIGTLVAGLLLSADELGLLKASERLAALLGFAQLVTNAVIGPSLAGYQQSGQKTASAALFRKAAAISIAIGLPMLCLCWIAPSALLRLFGAEFAPAATLLIVLAAGQFINVACGPVLLLLNLSNHGRDARKIVLSWSVAGTLMIWAGAAGFGAVGAAVAVAAAMVGQNLTAAWQAYRRTGIALLV